MQKKINPAARPVKTYAMKQNKGKIVDEILFLSDNTILE